MDHYKNSKRFYSKGNRKYLKDINEVNNFQSGITFKLT